MKVIAVEDEPVTLEYLRVVRGNTKEINTGEVFLNTCKRSVI